MSLISDFCSYIQLTTFAYKRLLNKPYENEVYLTGQSKRKIVASPRIFDILFKKRFRSFYTVNIGFVGNRSSKLLAGKVGGLK